MTPDTDRRKSPVFLVDDHPLVREWLTTLINQQPDLKVCGEAAGAAEALKLIAAAKPRIVIVDISLEEGSGLELIKNIKAAHPDIAVIVLSMHDEVLYAERALRAGARGYLMKRDATRNVLPAVRRVLEGKIHLSETIALMLAGKLVTGVPPAQGSAIGTLSNRELEVFQLLSRGFSTRQIAAELHISFRTVQAFCARIKDKLSLSSATELLREALRWHDRQ
jgi:DNA-binding NarL/FixJ family response regulator